MTTLFMFYYKFRIGYDLTELVYSHYLIELIRLSVTNKPHFSHLNIYAVVRKLLKNNSTHLKYSLLSQESVGVNFE